MKKDTPRLSLTPITIDIILGLHCFFDSDLGGIIAWLTAKNPNFGNIEPLTLINIGKAKKVQDFINTSIDANEEL